jgi:protein gp37
MISESGIEWCDYIWNPVDGCKGNCTQKKKFQCYAEKYYNRFKDYLPQYKKMESFQDVQWNENNFQKSFPKKPSRIFVGSMSDIRFWKPEWIQRVLKVTDLNKNENHTFIFLTKYPEIYKHFIFPPNCWLGITITKNADLRKLKMTNLFENNYGKNWFFSIEPIQEEVELKDFKKILNRFNWIMVGTETPERKSNFHPSWEWAIKLIHFCEENKIPLFIKNNFKVILNGKIIDFYYEINISDGQEI